MFRDTVRSLLALAALTVICGVAFPLVVWGIGQVGLSGQADGSLVKSGGRPRSPMTRMAPAARISAPTARCSRRP
jgi:K+-transporting ATPase c subunit